MTNDDLINIHTTKSGWTTGRCFAVVALGLFGTFLLFPGADPDLFARVAVGRLTLTTGSVPKHDVFAYTPTNANWFDHEWLSGVLFYTLSQWGGDHALFLFKLIVALLTLSLIYLGALRNSSHASPRTIALILACALPQLCSVWTSTIRCRVFTHLFLVLLFLAFIYFRKNSQRALLWCVPLVMVLWTNMHGGFVLGLVFLGIFTGTLLIERGKGSIFVLLILSLSLLATLVNPYGVRYLEYVLHAVTMDRSTITEWLPVNPFSVGALVINFFALVVLWGIFTHRQVLAREAIPFSLLALVEGYRHDRLGPIFLIIGILYFSDSFSLSLASLRQMRPRAYDRLRTIIKIDAIAVAIACALFAIVFVVRLPRFQLDYSRYPVLACEWLFSNRSNGKVLTEFTVGSYALWRLYPKHRIATDGRYEEVYPQSTHLAAIRALDPIDPGQRNALLSIWPDYIILNRQSATYEQRHTLGSEWREIYHDSSFSILSTHSGSPEPRATGDGVVPRPTWLPSF